MHKAYYIIVILIKKLADDLLLKNKVCVRIVFTVSVFTGLVFGFGDYTFFNMKLLTNLPCA